MIIVLITALMGQVPADNIIEKLLEQSKRQPAPDPGTPKIVAGTPIEPPGRMPELPREFRFERPWQNGKMCGPVALYILLNLQGRVVSYEDVRGGMTVGADGTSMAALQDTAAQFGVRLRPVKVAADDLKTLPTPFLVHWMPTGDDPSTGHFDVVIGHVEGIGYDTVDTSQCLLKRINYSSASPQFDGYALILDRSDWGNQLLWAAFYALLAGNLAFFTYGRFRK